MAIGAKVVTAASNVARNLGQTLDKMGAAMEVAKYTERLVPSTRFVAVNNIAPTINPDTAFIAPSANIVGDVSIGSSSSVWYNSTIRGDGNKVSIGSNTNIGDCVVVHIAQIQGDFETNIGSNVSIGPNSIIHAATLKDDVCIGAGSQILDGATIGSNVFIEPGTIVTPGTTVPDGEVWSGSPAKFARKVTKEDIDLIQSQSADMVSLALLHAGENEKDYKTIAKDEEEYEDKMLRSDDYFQPQEDDPTDVLGQGAPGRIFDNALSEPEEGLKKK